MNRKVSILLLGFVLALLICTATFTNNVQAKDDKVVVIATGDDTANCERADLPGVFVTQDVCNVQAAVNENPGGTVILMGTFHFAEYGEDGYAVPDTDGTVFITNDVTIEGIKDDNGYRTKIKGGYYTFSIGHQPRSWAFHL